MVDVFGLHLKLMPPLALFADLMEGEVRDLRGEM
jgi:hypothetical protein